MNDTLEKVGVTEVIAKRKNGLIGLYGFTAGIGIVAMLPSIPLFLRGGQSSNISAVSLLIFGFLIFVISAVVLIGICKTPKDVIIYENGVLRFPDGFCNVSELQNVEYRRASAKSIQYQWGKIILILKDRTVKYNYVADVVQVHNRLIQLMLESKRNNRG